MKKKPKKNKYSQKKISTGLMTLFLACLLVVGSTFAWKSWVEWKENHFQGDSSLLTPMVKVVGETSPVRLNHNKGTSRKISVKNTGQMPVFVRVDLAERLLSFEVDTRDGIGNGHLQEYPNLPTGAEEITSDIVSTWKPGSYLYDSEKTAYTKAIDLVSGDYLLSESTRPESLKNITINFGQVDPGSGITSGFWMYEEQGGKGYYYYSDVLEVGESTTELLTSLELKETAPNQLKGSLYKIDVNAAGAQVEKGVFQEWGIQETSGNKVYEQFNKAIK